MPRHTRIRPVATAVLLLLVCGATLAGERANVGVIVLHNAKPAPRLAARSGADAGWLDLNVRPKTTEVWVNGSYRGTCASFDGFPGKLALDAGIHTIRLVTPDGLDARRDLRVYAGVEFNVGLDLR